MPDNLKDYKQKRNFNKTPEPKPAKKSHSKKKLRFVVQHHLARKDHYDFRLELNGTLKSWAVPKGPSYDPSQKRLAIMVEDHPLEYRNFEGIIPKGEYGGGVVVIWDQGYWEALGNPKEDLKKGSIKFILHGKRLKGCWSLIYFKENNWLLIKEKDSINLYSDINQFNTSVKTGRTFDQIEKGIKKIKNSKKNYIVETIKITHPDKLMFNKPKVTKYYVALYYQKVAKRMLPFVENRILSTIVCPDGIKSKCFFKKHFEDNCLGLGKIILSDKDFKKQDYYYILDIVGLIYQVQMNCIEFHVWGSNVNNINYPNILVFDLDPDENLSITKIRQGVKDLKSILDELSLTSFLKTSGNKGYHVVVPTKKLKSWQQCRDFAQNIAKLMEAKWPNLYTSNMAKAKRKGKIYIDWLRNTKQATSVAPYSLRAKENPRVSMPIKWSELDKIKPDDITIDKAIKRLKRKDPWENFWKIDQ